MHCESLTAITPIRKAAQGIGRSISSFYDLKNPNSARYDAELPATFKIGRSTFVVTAELEAYIQQKITARNQLRTIA